MGFLKSANAVLVENMTGFRMSFRTDILRQVGGFDENLGAVVGYSQYEDMEVCMSIMDAGLLLAAAHDAKICHHKFPGTRSRGFAYGFCQIFNMLYIIRKHSGEASPQWRICMRHIRFKLFMYAIAAKSSFGRERFKGAWEALKSRSLLRGTTREELAQSFIAACRIKIGISDSKV